MAWSALGAPWTRIPASQHCHTCHSTTVTLSLENNLSLLPTLSASYGTTSYIASVCLEPNNLQVILYLRWDNG
jgi:hypothetical protein